MLVAARVFLGHRVNLQEKYDYPPEESLASQQVLRAYVATIEALPERCRQAFVLHVFDEWSHARIAQHMGISVSMVEKHVVRAMVACKQCQRRLRPGGDGRPD